jgi:hypothetical protein
MSSIPERLWTKGIADLVDQLSESEACRELIRQAKAEKAKRIEEKRKLYELGEDVETEETERIVQERPQKVLEKEFAENSLVVVGRNERFFKPYRKETDRLQEKNEGLKREIANLRKIFSKHKKDTKNYIRETVNKENQDIIIGRIKNVISCLYSETPSKKREKVQTKEDNER